MKVDDWISRDYSYGFFMVIKVYNWGFQTLENDDYFDFNDHTGAENQEMVGFIKNDILHNAEKETLETLSLNA